MKEEYRFKTKPFRHQLEWWLKSRDLPHFAVFWEMGTGKSKLVLDTAAWLWDQGKIDSLLVIANKGSYMNWADEHVPKHLPDHVKRSVAWWDAAKVDRSLRGIAALLKEKLTLRILLLNVEALAYDKGRRIMEQFGLATRCLCVVDESTSLKNPKALRTKTAIKHKKLFRYRRILTGSPAANGPLNLYSQAEFLGDWLLGHASYYSFRNEYCQLVDMRVNNVAFKKVTGYKNLDKLGKVMEGWSSTIKKEDCLDLPPKVYETYLVELTMEQKKAYEDLKRTSMAELSGGVVTVQIVLTKLLRLQQIVCGAVPTEEGNVVRLPENRLAGLLEVVEETSGKMVIWARFVDDIKRIKEALEKAHGEGSVVAYYGETDQQGRRDAVRLFQEDMRTRFFVGNPQTGGYGITLTAAATVVYYSNSFDLETRVQSEDRCHRVGQKKSVTYVDLCCRGTVDEKIIKVLREKRRVSDLIMSLNGWKELF